MRRWTAVLVGLALAVGGTAAAASPAMAVDRPTGPCPGGREPREMSVMEVKKMIARHEEGTKGLSGSPTVYVDTEGHPTVGIGFNLDRADAREKLTGVGANYDAVRAGTASLTQAQITGLFEADVAYFTLKVQQAVSSFSSLSLARQAALVDMMYNLGENRFAGFQKMITAIEQGNFAAAASEMLSSQWARQVGSRASRLAELVRSGLTCDPPPPPVAPPPVSPDIPGLPPIGNGLNNGGTSYGEGVNSYQPEWSGGNGGGSGICGAAVVKVIAVSPSGNVYVNWYVDIWYC